MASESPLSQEWHGGRSPSSPTGDDIQEDNARNRDEFETVPSLLGDHYATEAAAQAQLDTFYRDYAPTAGSNRMVVLQRYETKGMSDDRHELPSYWVIEYKDYVMESLYRKWYLMYRKSLGYIMATTRRANVPIDIPIDTFRDYLKAPEVSQYLKCINEMDRKNVIWPDDTTARGAQIALQRWMKWFNTLDRLLPGAYAPVLQSWGLIPPGIKYVKRSKTLVFDEDPKFKEFINWQEKLKLDEKRADAHKTLVKQRANQPVVSLTPQQKDANIDSFIKSAKKAEGDPSNLQLAQLAISDDDEEEEPASTATDDTKNEIILYLGAAYITALESKTQRDHSTVGTAPAQPRDRLRAMNMEATHHMICITVNRDTPPDKCVPGKHIMADFKKDAAESVAVLLSGYYKNYAVRYILMDYIRMPTVYLAEALRGLFDVMLPKLWSYGLIRPDTEIIVPLQHGETIRSVLGPKLANDKNVIPGPVSYNPLKVSTKSLVKSHPVVFGGYIDETNIRTFVDVRFTHPIDKAVALSPRQQALVEATNFIRPDEDDDDDIYHHEHDDDDDDDDDGKSPLPEGVLAGVVEDDDDEPLPSIKEPTTTEKKGVKRTKASDGDGNHMKKKKTIDPEPKYIDPSDYDDYLYIAKAAEGKGYGLFAKRNLRANTAIQYLGKTISPEYMQTLIELSNNPKNKEMQYTNYTASGSDGTIIDSNPRYVEAKEGKWYGSRVNEPDAKTEANMVLRGGRGDLYYVTMRPITAGEELTALYARREKTYYIRDGYTPGRQAKMTKKWQKKKLPWSKFTRLTDADRVGYIGGKPKMEDPQRRRQQLSAPPLPFCNVL